MKVLVAVCIHDRFENLRRWIHAWNQCHQKDSELVVIHNSNGNNEIPDHCKKSGVKCFVRENVGFETGVIQDIFLKKIRVPRWDALLFCTDDTIPIRKDFIHQFRGTLMNQDVGVACMEISGVWTPHIRTTGFCVKRDVARNIHWVHYPITNKEQCYFFEHQGFEDTFMSQVLKMDKRVIQLSSVRESVLWDTDHNAHHNRMDEWHREFTGYNQP